MQQHESTLHSGRSIINATLRITWMAFYYVRDNHTYYWKSVFFEYATRWDVKSVTAIYHIHFAFVTFLALFSISSFGSINYGIEKRRRRKTFGIFKYQNNKVIERKVKLSKYFEVQQSIPNIGRKLNIF